MRAIYAFAVTLLAASLLFSAYPSLDLATSRLFFNGTTFPIAANPFVEVVRVSLIVAEDAGFLAVLTLSLFARKTPVLNLTARDWLFQTLIFGLGPGLIVNGILKRFWGRARPFRIGEFGGDATFSRAWAISDQCSGNCSFVSGEMAGATALAICLVMILRANRQNLTINRYRMGMVAALCLPVVTGWQRIAVGRHFLSDTVIAALLVALLAAVLHRIICRKRRAKPLLTSLPIPPISRLP